MQGGVDLTDLMRADSQQTLTITILDGLPQIKTRQDVNNMTFHEFASLTAVSITAVPLAIQQLGLYNICIHVSCVYQRI